MPCLEYQGELLCREQAPPQELGSKIEKAIFAMMLTGSDLLAKVEELSEATKSEIVRACGYSCVDEHGRESLDFIAFYEALVEARSVEPSEIQLLSLIHI